jgi:hypothetical protein
MIGGYDALNRVPPEHARGAYDRYSHDLRILN